MYTQSHWYITETSNNHIGLATPSVIYKQASRGTLLEMQNLEPHPRLTDSESAFLQDPWMILLHIKFEQALV